MASKPLKPFANEVASLFADVVCPEPEAAAHPDTVWPDRPEVIARYGLPGKTLRQVLDSRAFDIPSIETVGDYHGMLNVCTAEGLRFFLPLFVCYAAIEELNRYEFEAEVVPCVAGYLSVEGSSSNGLAIYEAAFSAAERCFFCNFFSAFREAVPLDWKMCRGMSTRTDRLCKS